MTDKSQQIQALIEKWEKLATTREGFAVQYRQRGASLYALRAQHKADTLRRCVEQLRAICDD